MPRRALPSKQKKQIMSVSLPLPVIDRLTETTSNRSKFVLDAIQDKLNFSSRPTTNRLIEALNQDLEEIKTIQQSYNINPAILEELHHKLTELYYLMNGEE
tara:strand:+ start:63 stop:365 length:303 start_codon:yes stop_codon:yes gene_type:complete